MTQNPVFLCFNQIRLTHECAECRHLTAHDLEAQSRIDGGRGSPGRLVLYAVACRTAVGDRIQAVGRLRGKVE